MMANQISKRFLRVLLVSVLAVYPNLAAWRSAQAAVSPKPPPSVLAKTGTVKGTALTSDLKPAANIKIKVVNADGKVVASATTDGKGAFSLPNLKAGEYQLQVGKDVQLRLVISDTSTVTNLRMVLPQGTKVGAAGVPSTGGGLSFIQVGAIGLAVVGGGIGIAYATDSSDDSHD